MKNFVLFALLFISASARAQSCGNEYATVCRDTADRGRECSTEPVWVCREDEEADKTHTPYAQECGENRTEVCSSEYDHDTGERVQICQYVCD